MKITDQEVKEIRRAFLTDKGTVPELAEQWKISESYAYRLCANEVRKNPDYNPSVFSGGNRLSAGALQIVDYLRTDLKMSYPAISKAVSESTVCGKVDISPNTLQKSLSAYFESRFTFNG